MEDNHVSLAILNGFDTSPTPLAPTGEVISYGHNRVPGVKGL